MSSRELLVLLDGLSEIEESLYAKASQRTFRIVEALSGEQKGELFQFPAVGPPPKNTVIVAEYVDWTHDRKLLARNTTEIASMRADGHDYEPDLTGLVEPLRQILEDREREQQERFTKRAGNFISDQLYGRR